jgi:hypothetical protein
VDDAYRATTLGAQAFCEGLLLGALRLASGSILPGVALQMATSAVGLVALATAESFPIPGFTSGGGHTPAAWLVPAALSVALGLNALRVARGDRGPARS